MALKLRNLGRWSAFDGKALVLPAAPDHQRRIKIEVNSEFDTRYDVECDGVVSFLGVAKGLELLDFVGVGTVTVTATSVGDVFFVTNDGEQTAVAHELASFTKIANREARNPHLEAILWSAHQSDLRRQQAHDAMIAEMNAKLAQIEAAKAGAQGDEAGAGSVDGGGVTARAEGDDSAATAGEAGGEGQPKPSSRPKKAAAGVQTDGAA